MKLFLVYVRDEDFYSRLPDEKNNGSGDHQRIRVMAFPPLGIQTLAPAIRKHGHEVRMFDTCQR